MTLNKNGFIGICLAIWLLFTSFSAAQQNPFFSQKKTSTSIHRQAKASPPHPIFIKLAYWQKLLGDRMAVLIDQAQTEARAGPLMFLLAMAFLYGMLHAAGPGHGKVVTISYMIPQKPSLGRSLLLGNGVALAHCLSDILLILSVHLVIKSGMIGPLESTTRVTKYMSYSLIMLLGLALIVKSLAGMWRQANKRDAETETVNRKTIVRTLPVAIAVGMVPCPGVVMVMLLSMSMNMIVLGVALGVCIALGMAVTITLVVVAFMYVKKAAISSVSKRPRMAYLVSVAIELMAGILIAVLGGLMLYGTLN